MRIGISSQQNTSLIRTNLSNNNNKIIKNGDNGGKTIKKNPLEILMERKSKLEDKKNTIMAKALKDGGDELSVKEKTADIDKQIQEVDNQISKIELEKKRKAVGFEDKDKKGKKDKEESNNNSDENIEKESSMKSILDISSNLKMAKGLLTQKKSMSNEAAVLKGEIKIDESRRINPIAKRKLVAKMEENIMNISEKMGNTLNEVNTKTKKSINQNSSNNSINKNQRNKEVNGIANLKVENKLSIAQQKVEENIQHYADNVECKSKGNGESIDNIA